MKIYTYNLQGRRNSNEDTHISITNLNKSNNKYNNINLFGVFDGHGGKRVSKYLSKNLPDFFINKFDKNIYLNNNLLTKYIHNVYDLLQTNLKNNHPRVVEYCGSTACVVIHTLDKKKNNILWAINVGDSRAIICDQTGTAIQLTVDHKPNLMEEKDRIEKLGGKITFDGYEYRIKSLSLSRAFGDLDCCPYVTHLPNIYKYKIKLKDKFLIIACDGLYETLTNQEAVEFIRDLQFKNYNLNYAKALAELAYNKGSQDNITVIIYFFNFVNI